MFGSCPRVGPPISLGRLVDSRRTGESKREGNVYKFYTSCIYKEEEEEYGYKKPERGAMVFPPSDVHPRLAAAPRSGPPAYYYYPHQLSGVNNTKGGNTCDQYYWADRSRYVAEIRNVFPSPRRWGKIRFRERNAGESPV